MSPTEARVRELLAQSRGDKKRREGHVFAASQTEGSWPEMLRGGALMVLRWFVVYPLVYGTYQLSGLGNRITRREGTDDEAEIIVSNHTNSMYDMMITQLAGQRWNFFLADNSTLRIPLWVQVLRLLRGIPVARKSTRGWALSRDEIALLFSRLADRLVQGHGLNIFPEGESKFGSSLRPLRYGVARIAADAQEKAGWVLPLKIQILGLNYENSRIAGSVCLAAWAEPIDTRHYREAWLADSVAAEHLLLLEIQERLQSVVIEAPDVSSLHEAHRLAKFREQHTIQGVRRALSDLQTGRATPVRRTTIDKTKGESPLFQVLAFLLFGIIGVVGWPFRTFGRVAAKDPSQEVCYGLLLWFLCLTVGFTVSDLRWALQFSVVSLVASRTWLWAWRRGVVR